MATILVVDDEKDIAELVAFTLKKQGHNVVLAYDGTSGLHEAFHCQPDLIILDQMMPGLDGHGVLKELKRDTRTLRTPVIFLTARAQTEDKIRGLESGVDDYVTKPFSNKELALRVEAVLKRCKASASSSTDAQFGPFRFDKNHVKFYIDNEPISVTSTEFKLLLYLMEHAERDIDRQELLRSIWGYNDLVYSRTLDTHIKRVRQKLEAYADCIETVRGVGYRFNPPTSA